MDNETLTKIFSDIGKKHDYERVNANFEPYADFKVKWERSYRWAEFHVSDYLADAPEDVIEALAETMFARICGQGPAPGEPVYPIPMLEYITSQDFRDKYREIWTFRHNAVFEKDWPGSDDIKVYVGKKVGGSPLMRAVIVRRGTPDDEIEKYVSDLKNDMKQFEY